MNQFIIIVCLVLFSCSSGAEQSNRFKPPVMPSSVYFAGEKVPLEDKEVYERLDRELITNMNYHTSTMIMLKSQNRYKQLVMGILKENEIPEDFFYLAVAESALNVRALSPANALGLWQFIPATAATYGMEMSSTVDERRHIAKSTLAACKYFKDAYKEFKNWTLVAASYNRGIKGIRDSLAEQKAVSYYDLYLNPETSRYVFRIIALKLVLSNPSEYGYEFTSEMEYPHYKYKAVLVNQNIESLPDFANTYGITYKELVNHNAWIKNNTIKLEVLTGKTYEFLIPEN